MTETAFAQELLQLNLSIPNNIKLSNDMAQVLVYIESVIDARADKLREVCYHLKNTPKATIEINGQIIKDRPSLDAFCLGVQLAISMMEKLPLNYATGRLTPLLPAKD